MLLPFNMHALTCTIQLQVAMNSRSNTVVVLVRGRHARKITGSEQMLKLKSPFSSAELIKLLFFSC